MSMLAERRRKQKWAVDPQNTAWSNDDSKFGQRMLEKMGWSKGKGLGAQEQGATDHIKVQVKNNHLGLGATINNEDNWIAHQDDFNQLLAKLNTCHGQETTGKDLSSRSKTDLDCIFGKRQSQKTAEGDASSSTPDENESTTTSAFTIQEYFAQRMAALKNKPQVPDPGPDLSETQVDRKKKKKRNKEAAGKDGKSSPKLKAKRHTEENLTRDGAQEQGAKKKSAGKQLRGPCWDQGSETSAQDAGDCEQPPEGLDFTLKPKKRRGKKKLQKPVEIAEDATPEDTPVKKKKKKKDFK
ncbi:PIN2/TERF1-interacting telomerase inhibitor 1 isoform X2 [Cebus imitator]|uniref:PIN2/TERF1-interacting telomerase inhibitor 1 isoform X2 n=1 Tax=Cebus imitator TaxID=2715852 RepID=UPI000809DED2|nr:PIN2/TERF1-interacting telomerase inhibitor 1 isoform X2 [Cebus imitator]